jgi:outer membrane lipopolysaccharide assembly protein LptE/RlpB
MRSPWRALCFPKPPEEPNERLAADHASRTTDPLALVAALALLTACGYHTTGHTDLLPKNIRTIAIPAFGNVTTRYKLADYMSRAVTREFLERTRYAVVQDTSQADAILLGAVTNFSSYPTVFDPKTSRASEAQVNVNLSISLTDRATGKVLFTRPNLQYSGQYEISTDQQAYFEESDVALDRISREAARAIVSAVLENF